MPKIRIIEKDLTPALTSGQSDTVVFMAVTGASATPKLLPGTLSATELETELKKYTEDGSNIKKILDLGGKVLVCDTYTHAKDFITDRNQYDVKFLLVKENPTGNGETEGTADLTTALEIAEARRDCAVVFGKTKSEYAKGDATALTNTLTTQNDTFLDSEEKKSRGKYCIPVFGKLTVGTETLDAGVAYILAFLNSRNKFGAEWLAVAGARKSAIPVDGLKAGDLKESEIDDMQPREATAEGALSVNPICNVTPWGVRIWGNRTALPLQPIKGTTKYGLVASSFANIRVLICDIKKALYKAARGQQFEQNTDVLWVNFTSEVNQLLEQMVQSYGIAGYKWIRTETKERAKLTAILRIVPIEPVEDFDLTIELADSLEVTE